MSQARVPAWISVGVLPAVNILLAFLVSAILFYYLDISPIEAAEIMWYGAFGTGEGIGFTLYYATGFIFTGLAVAVAFHAGLFNIGGEGQAYIGGLGVGLVCLLLGDVLPFALLLPLALLAGCQNNQTLKEIGNAPAMSPIGSRNREWIVWPPTLSAAIPVGATTRVSRSVVARSSAARFSAALIVSGSAMTVS